MSQSGSQGFQASKPPEELRKERERFYSLFVALNFTGHELFADKDDSNILMYDGDPTWQDDDNHSFIPSMPLPPGQEGVLHSYDSQGTYENVLKALLTHKNRYGDARTCWFHTEKQTVSWAQQHEALVDAFMDYKAYGLDYPGKNGVRGAWTIKTVSFNAYAHKYFYDMPGSSEEYLQ
ncbi:hypothetical protein AAF712_014067 [Marasmius tenuissimus]|uniref:Uncharacterized protein n=1 Tax=Marasmius tenuissimus TaxID=585030 RepID=A0ABR2ZCX9_9AGAR